MSPTAHLPEYHVVNFFHDDQNDCALTVRVNDVRFHVIVETARLKGRSAVVKEVNREYRRLLRRVKKTEEEVLEDGDVEYSDVEEEEDAESQQQEQEEDGDDSDQTRDSAVDLRHDKKPSSNEKPDPTHELHEWILRPLRDMLVKQAPKPKDAPTPSLQDWYHCKTHFYRLAINDDGVIGEEEVPSEALEQRIEALIPSMPLPKYIRDLQIPMFNAQNVTVLATSTEVEPIHPALVRVDEQEYFLKVVDNAQHGPTKREIKLMKQIERKGLHEKMRVPLVRGLVHFNENNKASLGFLMDAIEGPPTPLTLKLDSEVSQEKREKWATESKRMVELLHENGIVWGDAKGDNFMVDKHDELWIIDFGGSYTEGWVDAELKETEEGDDMGVDKLVESLHNPDGKHSDASGDDSERNCESATDNADDVEEGASSRNARGRKRRAEDERRDDAENDEKPAQKKANKRR